MINGKAKEFSLGKALFGICIAFCFALILKNSTSAIQYVRIGLQLCVHTVIPSLFPFMVISELLVASGIGEMMGKIFSAPMRKIFGLSGGGASAAFLGSLCGFPIGAKTAISLYDKGIISKSETEHLMTFANNPSSAFLINAVGISLFASSKIGYLIYFCVLASGLITGFLARFFISSQKALPPTQIYVKARATSPISIFTSAISGAAGGMITVCAYIIFFSVLCGCLESVLQNHFDLPDTISAILFGLIEISGGLSRASSVCYQPIAIILSSFIAGWSGLSVHFQIVSICSGRDISFKPYFIAKMFQSLLSAILCATMLLLFPGISAPAVSGSITVFNLITKSQIATFISYASLIYGCVMILFGRKYPRILS